jgi:ABC-type transport system involved in multi-copper enzyme maturation permease subunit
MAMRLGPGPVFVYEWLTSARRWQLYALRVLFVGAILIGLAFVWNQLMSSHGDTRAYPAGRETFTLAELASFGQAIYLTIATIELSLILLAAPAATAGAVCLDKARGTLDHMLATDLSNAEIVLGKLGVRLIPVLGLVACVVPVVALSGLLGGIDPMALGGSFLVAIGCAVVGCSLAITLSVWARKTHEVVMMTYMIIILWLILPWLVAMVMFYLGARVPPMAAPVFWQLVIDTNPYYLVFAPNFDPAKVDLTTYLIFLGACLTTSGGLVGLATLRVRRVALRQAGRAASVPRRRLASLLRRPSWLPRIPGPPLDLNPVAWREWHRTRPSLMMRIAWALYAALGVVWLSLILLRPEQQKVHAENVGFMNAFQVAVGLLLLSVGAATSLAEGRVRGSLDVLLATPMSTRSILVGKFWGTFGQVKPVLFWPAFLSLWLLFEGGSLLQYFLMIGTILAQGAVITSLGLALATWVSRLGRAVAICVAAYVVFSIGWPILIAVSVSDEPMGPCLVIGCPAAAVFAATGLIGPSEFAFRDHRDAYWAAVAIWMVVDLAVAAALFAATVSSFDRCLGRIPEVGGAPRLPLGRSKAKLGRGTKPLPTEDPLASL